MTTTAQQPICQGCMTYALDSADQNWCDDKGRAPESDADYAEIDSWARTYVLEGMTTPCQRCEDHAEALRELG